MNKSLKVVLSLVVAVSLLNVVAITMVTSPTAKAGLWDSFMTSDWQTRSLDAKYQMEMYGFDGRVYEFTPLANPGWTCAFAASNESSGLACFPKAAELNE